MKIHIFYSHYNITGSDNKNRPEWFDYEKCFINLLNTIRGKSNIKLHIMMDGKIDENWISKYKDYYTYTEFNGGGIIPVTKKMYETIHNYECDENDLIYILENDYLHMNGWPDKIIELYQTYGDGLSYISLYDHNDKYFLQAYDELASKIVTTNSHHWRTTPSTCGSYIVTKKIINEDYDDQTGVTTPIGDHHKWLYLNDSKGRFILSPIPGLSTHCMKGLLSPTIDWENINNKI
jgi:hypothetical protein